MEKQFCVYLLTDKQYGTLYVGVTSNLVQRIWQHKNKLVDGFTKRYGLDKLVYFELHESADSAIQREKQIKKWTRRWKVELIQEINPTWRDLYDDIL